MSRLGWAALTAAALGAALTFSGAADPWPYVGAALTLVAPLFAVVAFTRPRRPLTAAAVLLSLIPLTLLVLLLYWAATEASQTSPLVLLQTSTPGQPARNTMLTVHLFALP